VARSRNPEDIAIDWNRVEGNWKEVKGKVKEKWAKLTDDDLAAINGQRDQLKVGCKSGPDTPRIKLAKIRGC